MNPFPDFVKINYIEAVTLILFDIPIPTGHNLLVWYKILYNVYNKTNELQGDYLAKDVELPLPCAGDILEIKDTGAYTMAMYCK
jgi:hypothetical protein